MKGGKMKKPIIIGVLIAAVAVPVLFWQLAGRASSPRLERFLPADTLAFVEAANLSEQTLRLVETKAWQAFSKHNPELATGALLGANYSGLLRADVAAAMIRLRAGDHRVEPIAVILAESDDENFKGSVETFIKTRFGDAQPSVTTEYRGIPIISYAQDQRPRLSYAQVDDLFIFSDRQDGVKEIINVMQGQTPSLATNARVAAMRQRLGYTDGLFGFADAEQLRRALHTVRGIRPHSRTSDIEQMLHTLGVDSVTAVGGVSSFEADGVVERLRVEIPNGGTGVVRSFLQTSASPRLVLSFVPASARHLFVASTGDVSAIYDQLYRTFDQIADPKDKAKLDTELAELGVDLKNDIVATLGRELAIADLSASEQGRHRGVAIIEVLDPERLTQSIGQIANRKGATVDETTHAGRQVMAIRGKHATHATYLAIVDNFLVIAESEDAIKAVIEAHDSGHTMAASTEYRQVFAGRAAAPMFSFYATNENLLTLMSQTFGKRNHITDAPSAAAEKLFPTALYGVAEPDGLYIESYSPLGTFPRLLTGLLSHLESLKQ
jgi:hypothetical protein